MGTAKDVHTVGILPTGSVLGGVGGYNAPATPFPRVDSGSGSGSDSDDEIVSWILAANYNGNRLINLRI